MTTFSKTKVLRYRFRLAEYNLLLHIWIYYNWFFSKDGAVSVDIRSTISDSVKHNVTDHCLKTPAQKVNNVLKNNYGYDCSVVIVLRLHPSLYGNLTLTIL